MSDLSLLVLVEYNDGRLGVWTRIKDKREKVPLSSFPCGPGTKGHIPTLDESVRTILSDSGN